MSSPKADAKSIAEQMRQMASLIESSQRFAQAGEIGKETAVAK